MSLREWSMNFWTSSLSVPIADHAGAKHPITLPQVPVQRTSVIKQHNRLRHAQVGKVGPDTVNKAPPSRGAPKLYLHLEGAVQSGHDKAWTYSQLLEQPPLRSEDKDITLTGSPGARGANDHESSVPVRDGPAALVATLAAEVLPEKGQTEVGRRLLRSEGVSVSEVDRVLAIEGELRSKRVVAEKSPGGERAVFEGDGVFIAAGAKPSVRILQGAGIRTHTQTNIPGVFAAGACASRGGWNVETCKGQGVSAGLSATVFLKLGR